MPAGERRTKDQEMAQRLKSNGDERKSGRCCICTKMVDIGGPNDRIGMDKHLIQCVARTPSGSTKAHRYREGMVRRRNTSPSF